MNEHIRPDHENLLESLVSGKLPRNLSWNSVVDLIGQIGEVRPHGNDEFAFVVGSQKEFFKYPSNHSLEVEEISRLRRFLKDAGVLGKPAKARQIGRMVVVIDHHGAYIFHDLGGNRPEDEVTVNENVWGDSCEQN
jgi:hypothetical protein